MKLFRKQSFALGLRCEYVMLFPVLASLIWVGYFFVVHHFLPQPFVFDVNDTFMDWFNTAFYANRPGAFDVWGAVYPPLSFVFLHIFSVHSCYGDPFNARDCDWIGITTILVSYVMDCVIAAIVFWRRDRTTALPRSLAFAFGMPLLFTLERGNLILVCLIPYMLVYGEMLGSKFSRALAIAATINFKPYLLVPSLALAVRRDWRGLEMAGLATMGLYLATLMIFGSGTLGELLDNTRNFVSVVNGQFWTFTYYSTSYSSLLTVTGSMFPILSYTSSHVVETALWLLPLLITITQLVAVVGLVAAWLQPRAITLARNVVLLEGAHLTMQSPGGYALTFLLFAVFLEIGRRPGQTVALVAAYILSINYDLVLATVVDTNAASWLSGRNVHVNFGLAVGQFIRPALVMLIVWSLAIDSITLSILAHRKSRPSLGLLPLEEPHLA